MKICGLSIDDAYEAYLTDYYGDMSEDDFPRYAVRASHFVSSITLGKIEHPMDSNIQSKALMAVFAVADLMFSTSGNGGGVIAETNDGVSVTYASSKDTRTEQQRMYDAAAQYLFQTGLLYRGVKLC